MKAQINLITILTDDVVVMTHFYRDVLGFKTETEASGSESADYVAFYNEGVRFSI